MGYWWIFVTKMSDTGASSLMTAFTGHLLAFLPLLLFLLAKKGFKGLKFQKRSIL